MTIDKKTEVPNPYLENVVNNLNVFIENINCLRETFGYSEGTLNQQQKDADSKYSSFMEQYRIKSEDESIRYQIPFDKLREQKKLEKRKFRAEKAFDLIPPTYIVSLVSLFDSFFAGLVRLVYSLAPEKLQESCMAFQYRDLLEFDTISEVKVKIIDNAIENLLRDSHANQFGWLEKMLGLKTLKKFDEWPDFVELTERRNLFVHSDGVVSSQYISECKKHSVNLGEIKIGARLTANKEYFDASYKLVYKMSIMLTQILLNKLYIGVYSDDTADRDRVLITNVYDLISDKLYDVAISISKFARAAHYKHTAIDASYILLNLAQSYKWSGKCDECKKLLDEIDTTTWNNDLLIPKLTLEEKYNEVYQKMKSVGRNSDIVTITAYREWPIFKEIRIQEEFKHVFREVFEEDVEENQTIKVPKEDGQEIADVTTTE